MDSHFTINNEIIRQVLSDIESASRKIIGENLVKIILYGSLARGQAGGESDIDIMLLVDEGEENIRKYDNEISKIVFDLSLKHNILLSVILKNYSQFNNYLEVLPFYKNVNTEGIEIYGRKAA